MRNTIILFLVFTILSSFIAIEPQIVPKTEPNYELTYSRISNLNYREVEKLTGEKFGFKEKMTLKLIQNNLKKEIKKGTINGNDKVNFKNYYEPQKGKFVASAFFLGLFLGLVGVIIVAYTSKKKDDISSAWMGFGLLAMILIILYLQVTNAV